MCICIRSGRNSSMFKSTAVKKFNGYTLIEILVVTTIIGLLVAVVSASYTQLMKRSRDAKRKADLEQVRAALEMYRSNDVSGQYHAYSGDCSGYTDLTTPTKYIEKMPSDPKSTYSYGCSITTSDYTIGAFLESTTGADCGIGNCTGSAACNYCLGPYGQK